MLFNKSSTAQLYIAAATGTEWQQTVTFQGNFPSATVVLLVCFSRWRAVGNIVQTPVTTGLSLQLPLCYWLCLWHFHRFSQLPQLQRYNLHWRTDGTASQSSSKRALHLLLCVDHSRYSMEHHLTHEAMEKPCLRAGFGKWTEPCFTFILMNIKHEA